MKRFKKLLSTLLVAVMLVGASPAVSAAEEENPYYPLSYEIVDGEVCITDCDFLYEGEIVIPESIDGYPVKKIGRQAFGYCCNLSTITIPDTVTYIADGAFYGCSGLTSINIPYNVTYIGNNSFIGCNSLSIIKVDENNNTYDSRNECNAIIETNTNTLIIGCKSTIIPDSVTSIHSYAFYECRSLTNITIPDSVISIGVGAFQGCRDLTSVSLSNSITSIDVATFWGCDSLKSITIPDKVKSLGRAAFSNCSSLISIAIPDGVTNIGEEIFSYCSSLVNIKVDANNTIYDNRDNCNAIIITATNTLISGCKTTTIPSSVTSILDKAFYGCRSLTKIAIPKSIKNIGYSAFSDCSSLTDVYYTGTEEQWEEIRIGEDNEALTNATIHFNYAPAHTHTLSHITVSSTCKVAGMEYDICTDCGETFNAKTLQLAAHTWGEWAVVKEPTTTAEGKEKRVCSVCGEEETRAIAKINGIRDGETGIEIVYEDEFSDGTELKVEQQFDGASFQLINTAYGQTNSVIYKLVVLKILEELSSVVMMSGLSTLKDQILKKFFLWMVLTK